jgi:hypothetical protein
MEVIKCGSMIRTKLGELSAIITAISIRFDRITYEVSYFYNGEYKCVWLSEDEFSIDVDDKQKIGFKC